MRYIKVIVQKGTKSWSKINSHVNNMYFTLKSPRYVALSFREEDGGESAPEL